MCFFFIYIYIYMGFIYMCTIIYVTMIIYLTLVVQLGEGVCVWGGGGGGFFTGRSSVGGTFVSSAPAQLQAAGDD